MLSLANLGISCLVRQAIQRPALVQAAVFTRLEQNVNKTQIRTRYNPSNIPPNITLPEQEGSKLMYEGTLSRRILYLKGLSIISSLALSASYATILNQRGLSPGLVGVGIVFIPFFVSPIVISWFFKRYVTKLYYNPISDNYTVFHYGLLMNQRSSTFKSDQVELSDATCILDTFTVQQGDKLTILGNPKRKSFFLHDESLIDVESVSLYKKMLNLDRTKTRDVKSSIVLENKSASSSNSDERSDKN